MAGLDPAIQNNLQNGCGLGGRLEGGHGLLRGFERLFGAVALGLNLGGFLLAKLDDV
jgi:hypothetical protein